MSIKTWSKIGRRQDYIINTEKPSCNFLVNEITREVFGDAHAKFEFICIKKILADRYETNQNPHKAWKFRGCCHLSESSGGDASVSGTEYPILYGYPRDNTVKYNWTAIFESVIGIKRCSKFLIKLYLFCLRGEGGCYRISILQAINV